MNLKDEDELKQYALSKTSGYLTREQIAERINFFKSYIDHSLSQAETESWNQQIKDLNNWRNSETFKSGQFPQGIDTLILDLIEWRAVIYSIQNTETINHPFSKHVFFHQWLIGAGYAMTCIFGKLVSQHKDDNSLRNLWILVSDMMQAGHACSNSEAHTINEYFAKVKTESLILHFRHKSIAHNESSPIVEWNQFDSEIKSLLRTWSLISSWCSLGVIAPFRLASTAFSGLEHYYSQEEMIQLKAKRDEYISNVKGWVKTNLATGEIDNGATAFTTISIQVATNSK